MSNKSILALGFGILATAFVLTMLKSIVVLLSYKMKGDGTDFKALVNIFKLPLIALSALVLFIIFIVPILD